MFRAGVEIKPMDVLALRAGYGVTTSPEKFNLNGEQLDIPAAQNVSFGLGFISRKSFFADMACRYAFATDEYFMPYNDYILYEDGTPMEDAYAPEICNTKSAWKVLLTLGWRF